MNFDEFMDNEGWSFWGKLFLTHRYVAKAMKRRRPCSLPKIREGNSLK
jgi:hypothetical protein